jgi:tetratricopeptide (TPR) repeat protein
MFTVLPRSRLLDLQSTVAAQLESSHKATMDTLVKHLGKAIDAAKAASDFDPVLSEIDAAQSAGLQYDNSFGYSLQALRRYAGSWQELVALQSSASPKAKTALDALTRETASFAGDFRAKIEARRASIPGAEEKVPVVVPVKVPEPLPDPASLTLGNVEKYSKAFNQPRQGGQISSEDQVAASELMQVLNAKTKLMYQDPQPAIELYASRSYQPLGDYALPLAKVKSDLAIQALDFQFREIVPDAKDTVASYLKRVIATKIQAKDWQGVIDALQDSVVMSSTQGYLRQSTNADLAAFHSLQVGIHQEAAGQYSEAVESYLAALSSQGSLTPVDELSARLKAIQKNHPTEFADGTKAIAVHQQQAQEAMAAQVFARRAAEYGTPRGASPAGVSQPPAPVGTAPSPASH